MPASVRDRVERRRQTLRASGLRPVQIWVPDTRRPGFVDECRRQAEVVALADAGDIDLAGFLDAAWTDLIGDNA